MPEDPQNPIGAPSTQPAEVPTKPVSKSKRLTLFVIAFVMILGTVAAAGWAFQQKSKTAKSLAESNSKLSALDSEITALKQELETRKVSTGEANIDKNAFQSVFLKNGQVYFGKITGISETQIILEDIYYLKTDTVQVSPVPGGDTTGVSLVKLGNELHGPQDKMFIERKEVQYWENLKNDGQVAEAIAQYKKYNP